MLAVDLNPQPRSHTVVASHLGQSTTLTTRPLRTGFELFALCSVSSWNSYIRGNSLSLKKEGDCPWERFFSLIIQKYLMFHLYFGTIKENIVEDFRKREEISQIPLPGIDSFVMYIPLYFFIPTTLCSQAHILFPLVYSAQLVQLNYVYWIQVFILKKLQ